MNRYALTSLAVVGLGLGVLLSSPAITSIESPEPVDSVSPVVSTETYGNLPLYFEENNGQTDSQVRYFARTDGYSVFFTDSRIAFNLVLDAPVPRREAGRPDFEHDLRQEIEPATPTRTYGLYLDFIGANPSPALSGESLQDGITSYFHGSPDQWVTAVPHFGKVRYSELYPGIDAVFYGSARQVQYDFIVAPGADPSQIQLQFDPVESIRLADNGDLRLSLGDRVLTMNAPYTYQTIDGVEHEVDSRFVIDDGLVTFNVGEHDASLPLVIDPVLLYAGYIGGSGYEYSKSIVVDIGGNAYITGDTSSEMSFPVMAGPDLSYNGGNFDAFVAKVNPHGTALVYAGYIGGDGHEFGNDIAVDSSGSAYITGSTNSSETSFPVTTGPGLNFTGDLDAFVAKVNPAGTALVYAGYIGGSENDSGSSIAVDSSGSAYITGYANSNQTSFPVLGGPDLVHNGDADAYVAKVNPAGTALVYAGYIGGSGTDLGRGIALDSGGNAYVTGNTNSSQTSFPVMAGPDLTYNDGFDAFVAKVNPVGTALIYAGYIGGLEYDNGTDIAVNSDGSAYITGYTYSTQTSFPVVGGPSLTYNGNQDAFVAKVNPAGTALVYAGYVGGSSADFGEGIAIGADGSAYITGYTYSTQTSFPVLGGPDLIHNGEGDAFVAKVNPAGTALIYAGYIGGSHHETGKGIAIGGDGSVYITGDTNSIQTSFPVVGGPYLTHNGGLDAFVARISPRLLIQNAGFEMADSLQLSKAQAWKGSNLTKDKRKCNKVSPPATYSRSGECAFLFKGGAGERSKISQTIKPHAGTLRATVPLTLYAWIDGAPNYVLAKVVAYYTDGSRQAFSALMGPSVGYAQFTTAPFFLAKDTSKLKVSFQHTWTSGKLYIDDVAILTGLVDSRRSALLPVPELASGSGGWRSP